MKTTDLSKVPQYGRANAVFIGATQDHKFRAFDSRTGKVLWETQLETGAYATPCTYSVNGKQYVAVAVGGGRWKSPAGDLI